MGKNKKKDKKEKKTETAPLIPVAQPAMQKTGPMIFYAPQTTDPVTG